MSSVLGCVTTLTNGTRFMVVKDLVQDNNFGMCKQFNSDDYKQIKTKMKSSYGAKASAFSRTKLWNHYNLTLTEIKDKY
jgi:hypothetical protein